jgi:2'-5' RNA ligase
MRLFVAINFSGEVKDSLSRVIENLRASADRGNFTRRENLHLTLVFIGETGKADLVRSAVEKTPSEPFSLSLGGMGRFRRDGGDVYWLGVEKSPALSSLQDRLRGELARCGFSLESREFRPHLTLGREVVPRPGFDLSAFSRSVPKLLVPVGDVSLMKSERVGGNLTYTEIYKKHLEG